MIKTLPRLILILILIAAVVGSGIYGANHYLAYGIAQDHLLGQLRTALCPYARVGPTGESA